MKKGMRNESKNLGFLGAESLQLEFTCLNFSLKKDLSDNFSNEYIVNLNIHASKVFAINIYL